MLSAGRFGERKLDDFHRGGFFGGVDIQLDFFRSVRIQAHARKDKNIIYARVRNVYLHQRNRAIDERAGYACTRLGIAEHLPIWLRAAFWNGVEKMDSESSRHLRSADF